MAQNQKHHNEQNAEPPKMLDIDNSDNLEAASQSNNKFKRLGFWVSVITSSISLYYIFMAVSMEMLKPIFPDIENFVNSNWVSWGLHTATCLYLAYRLASLMDFYLIDIHGRAGITEYIIFFRIWSVKKQNESLGKYRNGITFARAFNATANLLLLFVGYFLSFMTSLLGSAEVGRMLLPSDATVKSAKINAIIEERKQSKKAIEAPFVEALALIEAKKDMQIKEQAKPYSKAALKGNAIAVFKLDSIRKSVNAQYLGKEKEIAKNYGAAMEEWDNTEGKKYRGELKAIDDESESRGRMSNMVSSGAKYSGTFAVTFSVVLLILQCFNEVGAKQITWKEVDLTVVSEAAKKGQQGKSNSSDHSPN